MTAADSVPCPEQAHELVQKLLTDSFPLDTTPISLHPVCILLRSDPLVASQLLMHTKTLNILSTLPNIVRSHILLVLHHTLSSLSLSAVNLKAFAVSALHANQIPTFALLLSRLLENDRNELITNLQIIISKESIVVWLNSFSDSPNALCSSLLSLLHNAVTKAYEGIPEADYIPLLQNILQLIQHVHNVDSTRCSDWTQLVSNVFRICPTSSLPDLCFVTETALSYQPILYEAIFKQFEPVQSLSASDIVLLMCLCCSRPYIDPVLSPIFKLISSKRHSPLVWKNVIRSQGNRAALLNLWSELWLEGSKDLAEIGSLILQQLFCEIDHSRKDVLQLIFNSITEYDEQADIQHRYIVLLSKLPVQHLLSFTSTIVDFIRYAGNLKPKPSQLLLSTLLPIVHLSNSALDQFILLFRKFMHSRILAERSLGAFGLSELLRTSGTSLSLSVQLEIVSCIESSLNLSSQQRSIVYSSLVVALSSSSLRLHQECYNALFKVLDKRLQKLISLRKGRASSLDGFVSVQDGNVQYQDNFAQLSVCHVLTMPHVVPRPTFRIFDCLFSNPASIFSPILSYSRHQFDLKKLLISVGFADACEHIAQLITFDQSFVTYLTMNSSISTSSLSVYLLELSSSITKISTDFARHDHSLRRLLLNRPDIKRLSPQFCLELLSVDCISCLPLSHLISKLDSALSKPENFAGNTIDRSSTFAPSSSSSSSSSSNIVSPTTILRVCTPLFISSLPWVGSNRRPYSSRMKSFMNRCDLSIDDSTLSYRPQLLSLIGSSVRDIHGLLPLTQICQFPAEKKNVPDTQRLFNKFNEIDCMALSWCFAMQSEFSFSIEVPLALAYIRLLEAISDRLSSDAQKKMSHALLSLLSSYQISSATLVKAMVKLVIILHADQAELLMKPTDQILLVAESCRSAIYDAVMSYSIESLSSCFNRLKPLRVKKLVITCSIVKSLHEVTVHSCLISEKTIGICQTFFEAIEEFSITAKLQSRLASVISRLFLIGHSLVVALSRLLSVVENEELPDESELFVDIESCLVFMTRFVDFIDCATKWITSHKDSFPSKLLSSCIFRISTFEQAVAAMVRSHRVSVASDQLENVADRLRLIADHPIHAREVSSFFNRKRPRRNRKHQLRSRIAYIDEALLEEEGNASDAYADLEDWIVD